MPRFSGVRALICIALAVAAAGCRKNFVGTVRIDGGAAAGAQVEVFAAARDWWPPECKEHQGSSWTSTDGSMGGVIAPCHSASAELDALLAAGKIGATPLASAEADERGAFELMLDPGRYDVFAGTPSGSGIALDAEPSREPIVIDLHDAHVEGRFLAGPEESIAGVATLHVILPRPTRVWTRRVGLSRWFDVGGLPRSTDVILWSQAPGRGSAGARPYTHHAVSLELPRLHSVSGVVIRDARPVAGARVQLETDEQSAITGADGRFSFAQSACTWCRVEASADGSKGMANELVRDGGSLELTIELGSVASLVVAVVDAQTRLPLAGAELHVYGASHNAPVERIDAGVFRSTELVKGLYDLTSEAEGWVTARASVEVGADGPREHIISMSRALGIEGRVEELDGGPVSGASVRVAYDASAMTGDGGAFSINGLRTGKTWIDVESPSHVRVRRDVELPAKAPIVVRLQPAGAILAHVQDMHGRPLHGAYFLVFQASDGADQHDLAHVPTDPEGNARLGPLAPGKYDVHVRFGRARVNENGIEVTAMANVNKTFVVGPPPPESAPALSIVSVENDDVELYESVAATRRALLKCMAATGLDAAGGEVVVRVERAKPAEVEKNTTAYEAIGACFTTAAASWSLPRALDAATVNFALNWHRQDEDD